MQNFSTSLIKEISLGQKRLQSVQNHYVGHMTGLGKQIQVAVPDTAVAKRQRNVKMEGRHISLVFSEQELK